MASSRKHSIILVGCHAFARHGLRQIIEELPQVTIIREHATTKELQTSDDIRVKSLLVVLDHRGNPANLISPLGELVRINSDLRIVLVSHTLSEAVLRRLSTAGVRAFVLDSDRPVVMKQAIVSVISGGMWIGPSVLASMSSKSNARLQLTLRERQVLELVRKGEANAAIARKLSITSSTVEFHLKNVFGKLGAHSRTDALFRAEQEDIELDG